jgi:hypothetical protein
MGEIDYGEIREKLQSLDLPTDAGDRTELVEKITERYGIDCSEVIRASSDDDVYVAVDGLLRDYGIYATEGNTYAKGGRTKGWNKRYRATYTNDLPYSIYAKDGNAIDFGKTPELIAKVKKKGDAIEVVSSLKKSVNRDDFDIYMKHQLAKGGNIKDNREIVEILQEVSSDNEGIPDDWVNVNDSVNHELWKRGYEELSDDKKELEDLLMTQYEKRYLDRGWSRYAKGGEVDKYVSVWQVGFDVALPPTLNQRDFLSNLHWNIINTYGIRIANDLENADVVDLTNVYEGVTESTHFDNQKVIQFGIDLAATEKFNDAKKVEEYAENVLQPWIDANTKGVVLNGVWNAYDITDHFHDYIYDKKGKKSGYRSYLEELNDPDGYYQNHDGKFAKGGKLNDFGIEDESVYDHIDNADLNLRSAGSKLWKNKHPKSDDFQDLKIRFDSELYGDVLTTREQHELGYAKGGKVKTTGNEMIIGGLAGILFGFFLNK